MRGDLSAATRFGKAQGTLGVLEYAGSANRSGRFGRPRDQPRRVGARIAGTGQSLVLQCICCGGESLTFAKETATTSGWIAAPTSADLMSGAVIAVCFVGLIVVAELWRAFRNPPAEWTRKLVHLGGGIICLSIPFFIHSHWVVLVLAAAMALIFIVSKRFGLLQGIHGVDRPSAGTEFYPVVIYLLFVLCRGVEWKFVICVLVLAVSDSAAALVGKRFGRLRFEVEKECKSVEGSAAFFAVTFAAVFVPRRTKS